jgi:thiopeptide-type bacteriocin biosynthesis protein
MRKPPDLRLRFCASRPLKSALVPLLARLQALGYVEHAYFSPYVPELERFGGRAALHAVHAWFDADTDAWLALDQLDRHALSTPTHERFCAHVASDLVRTLFEHAADRVEFWQTLARRSDPALLESAPQPLGEDAASDDRVKERALLLRYRDENRALAATLIELSRRDELLRPLGSILQSVIRFHWHRHGIDGRSQARLALGLAAELPSGRGEIRGVTPE